jgi:hypothetical protein
MARNLLGIVQSPENIPAMTAEELAHALPEDMQARLGDPIRGMLNRNSVVEAVMPVGSFQSYGTRASWRPVSIKQPASLSLCLKDGVLRNLPTT